MRVQRASVTIRPGLAGLPAAAALIACAAASLGAQVPSTAPAPGSAAAVAAAGVRIDSLLDLGTVIERARAASPAIAQSEEGLRVARSGLRVSTGAYLPTLALSSAALRSNVLSATGDGASCTDLYASSIAVFSVAAIPTTWWPALRTMSARRHQRRGLLGGPRLLARALHRWAARRRSRARVGRALRRDGNRSVAAVHRDPARQAGLL